MRIVLYEDRSILLDELSTTLVPGENNIRFPISDIVPGSLYLGTNYPYTSSIQKDGSTLIRVYVPEGTPKQTVTIPVIFSTANVTGKIRYFVNNGKQFRGEFFIDSNLSDPLTGNIGIGTERRFSSLDQGNDFIDYSLVGLYTINPNGYTIVPLDNVSIDPKYIVDLDQEKTYLLYSLERKGNDPSVVKPPYPGTLSMMVNEIPRKEMNISADFPYVVLGTIPSISVQSLGQGKYEIMNNERAVIPLILITSMWRPKNDINTDVSVSQGRDRIAPTIERVKDEVQISFETKGLGPISVSLR